MLELSQEYDLIKEIGGKGLMIAIDPPLNIDEKLLDSFIAELENVLIGILNEIVCKSEKSKTNNTPGGN